MIFAALIRQDSVRKIFTLQGTFDKVKAAIGGSRDRMYEPEAVQAALRSVM